MNFDLSDTQDAVLASVGTLLSRLAGPERSRELHDAGVIDEVLLAALAEAGFLDLALSAGPLDAALVVEHVQRHLGLFPAGASLLVGPMVIGESSPASLSLVGPRPDRPVRYAMQSEWFLVHSPDEARLVPKSEVVLTPLQSSFALVGAVGVPAGAGRPLGPGSGERLLRWWKVANAVELVGCMEVALAMTVDYVKGRMVFGKALSSLQAIQHRLAEVFMRVEAAKWLAREAAYLGAPARQAEVALTVACDAGKLVFDECHQFHGALGLTKEYALHLWSQRIHAIRSEFGGASVKAGELAVAHAAVPSEPAP